MSENKNDALPKDIISPPTFLDVDDTDLAKVTTIKALNKLLAAKETRTIESYETQAVADQQQLDLFVADLLDYSLKDDTSTMEAPLFSLSTKPDLDAWRWVSPDGKKWLEVTPSTKGRATIHDKDLLIYLASQLVAAMNIATKREEKLPGRRIRFTPHDFFVATGKDTGGRSYTNIESTIDRLEGTRIKTNIEIGNIDRRNSFGLIESASYLLEKDKDGDQRLTSIEITLSKWLYSALERKNILTISPRYFQLRKPLAKRLYELARRHVGDQAEWEIEESNLSVKAGSKAELREFRRMVKEIISDDNIPEYRIIVEKKLGKTIYKFYQKNPTKLALAFNKKNKPKGRTYKPRYGADGEIATDIKQTELPI
ncbi:replication initiator protein A [Undibacterium sp.]|uniref:replication initiator protein A n=1 Tax=Undibacterium sp. TaxID=1914977 RepID=UPI0037531DE8